MDSGPGSLEIRGVAEGGLADTPMVVDDVSVTTAGRRRVVRVIVARTLADLDGRDAVGRPHVAEAVGYRRAMG